MSIIYHIVPKANWLAFSEQPNYEADSLQTEGFIHLSEQEQVQQTLNRYYQNVSKLLLLHVDTEKLTHKLMYESSTNSELFPHLYGPLNKDAVVQVEALN